jgi:hypothetical protein
MALVTVQGIERSTISVEENHALDILVNLPGNSLTAQGINGTGRAGIVGLTTLAKFIQLCRDEGLI